MAHRYLLYPYTTKMETNGNQETHMRLRVLLYLHTRKLKYLCVINTCCDMDRRRESASLGTYADRLLLKRQLYLVRQTVSGGESSRCRSETLLVVLAPKDAMWHSNFSRLDAFCSVSHSGVSWEILLEVFSMKACSWTGQCSTNTRVSCWHAIVLVEI